MSNNDEKKLGKSEYFELREKRLKLVYRILYAIVAIWIATLVSISTQEMTEEIAPMYTFLLATSSLLIINIVKYALMEFRCMKVSGNIEESLLKQTEERYDNIWRSFSLILSLCALFMIIHIRYPNVFSKDVFGWVFAVCIIYFSLISIVEMFKKETNDKAISVLDHIGLFVGTITAYSICALMCLVAIK